jgi:hypothetical protein
MFLLVIKQGEGCSVSVSGVNIEEASAEAASHYARSLACSAIADVMKAMSKSGTAVKSVQHIVKEAIAEIKSNDKGHKHTAELLKDLEV